MVVEEFDNFVDDFGFVFLARPSVTVTLGGQHFLTGTLTHCPVPSNDMRFLGHMRLKSSHLKDYPPPGALVGVVGLAVGFGSNFLNAVHAENRLILNNGSHRAYTLREMGLPTFPASSSMSPRATNWMW